MPQPAFVQSGQSDGFGGRNATLTVVAGDQLVAIMVIDDQTTTSTISDDRANTWVQHASSPFAYAARNRRIFVWKCSTPAAGATVVTATNGGGAVGGLIVLEFSNLGVADGTSKNDSAGAVDASPGPITTTGAGVVIGFVSCQLTAAPATGYTRRGTEMSFGQFLECESETTPHANPATLTPSWTNASASWAALGLAYLSLVGPPDVPGPRLLTRVVPTQRM